jgi:hypothetical protein
MSVRSSQQFLLQIQSHEPEVFHRGENSGCGLLVVKVSCNLIGGSLLPEEHLIPMLRMEPKYKYVLKTRM